MPADIQISRQYKLFKSGMKRHQGTAYMPAIPMPSMLMRSDKPMNMTNQINMALAQFDFSGCVDPLNAHISNAMILTSGMNVISSVSIH